MLRGQPDGGAKLKVHIALRGGQRPVLCWDVFGLSGPWRGDDTNRRTFQSRCYGRTHAGTECVIHVEVMPRLDFVVHNESELIDDEGREGGVFPAHSWQPQ